MDTNTYSRLEDRLRRIEKLSPDAYWDDKGATVGYGHLVPMTRDEFRWIREGISPQEAEAQFKTDLSAVWEELQEAARGWIWELDPVRQAALTDMAYQMGVPALLRFTRMISAIRRKHWQGAHDECLDSKNYGHHPKAGVRIRAREVARMLLTGEWVP